MRISNRAGRLLGYCLMMTILPLSTLFAQEKDANLLTYLEKVTEEIPIQSKTRSANPINPPKGGVRTALQDITEEIPNHPKSKFMSTKSHSGGNFKIQLGYFKEKKNVNKMRVALRAVARMSECRESQHQRIVARRTRVTSEERRAERTMEIRDVPLAIVF